MLPLKRNNSVEVGIDEIKNGVFVVELLGFEQMQKHAAAEGEFGHEHLHAGRESQGRGWVIESIRGPSQIHSQTVPIGTKRLISDLE
jgi:hypothetical protein